MHKLRLNLAHAYMVLFLLYMIAPLVVMSGAAFNDSKLPSIVPWKGFTTHWFSDMIADQRMMLAFGNSLWVAVAVAVISILVGTASAIQLDLGPGAHGGLRVDDLHHPDPRRGHRYFHHDPVDQDGQCAGD